MAEKKETKAGSGFWQIIFPSLVFGILIILIGVLVVIRLGDGDLGRFAEVSTVLLVIPVLLSSLLLLIIFGAGIYLISRAMEGIPPITTRILEILDQIQDVIKKIADFIVQPVIRPSALLGGLRNIFSRGKTKLRIE
jgi:ABC-type microcin C transport system permease subunit YejB